MVGELVYEYEVRTLSPQDAVGLLGGVPEDNPHRCDDACPAWEPIRVVFDHNGRLLLGSDELAHIIGADRVMDAAIYREPGMRDRVPVEDGGEVATRPWIIGLLRRDYRREVANPVNWTGVVRGLAPENATRRQIVDLLAGMDVGLEYEWYRLALRIRERSGLNVPTVRLALLMHEQAAGSSRERVEAFWNGMKDRDSPNARLLMGVPRREFIDAASDLWETTCRA